MDNAQDFLSAFEQREVHEFQSETLEAKGKDSTVYIRSLSWAEKNRFHKAANMIITRLTEIAMRSINKDDSELIWKDDVKLSGEYLLKQSMCTPNGELLWSDETLKQWLDDVPAEVPEEILHEINVFNNVDGLFTPKSESSEDEQEDDLKKNNES